MRKKPFHIVLVIALTLPVLVGCSSLRTAVYSSKIKNVDVPLLALQQVIVGFLPAGLRNNSANGREFYSGYFIQGKNHFAPARDAVDRYYAQMTILGDSRPYDIEILVTQEKRVLKGNRYTYERIGHDSRLAKKLEQSLRTRLTKRREDRNIIDDFRVF